MSRVIIYPYKMESTSAAKLQEKFRQEGHECIRVYHNGSYRPRASDLIINWGNNRIPNWDASNILNHPTKVRNCTDKLKFFQETDEFNITPLWTTSKRIARLFNAESKVYARHTTTGYDGAGIEVIPVGGEIPDAPLYTKQSVIKREFRAHISATQGIIDTTEKLRLGSASRAERGIDNNPNPDIRNTANGYTFTRNSGRPIPAILTRNAELLQQLVRKCGLVFAALDIGVPRDELSFVVFEANSAPGIEGTTVQRYYEFFSSHL